jgi:phytoene synthase
MVAPVGRPVLRAIVGIYRALLDEIIRRDYDVLSGRVALPAYRKLMITLGSLSSRFARSYPEPVLAEPPRCG